VLWSVDVTQLRVILGDLEYDTLVLTLLASMGMLYA
jgi:hypothetical protein